MNETTGGPATATRRSTHILVAALSALLGFAAVYVTLPSHDNGAREAQGASAGPTAPLSKSSSGQVNSLSTGTMTAFVFRKTPEPVPEITFVDASGQERKLQDWKGKAVLLNLWATWCAPCRKEMPALDQLQKELGGERFEVVAISIDRSGIDGAKKFLDRIKIENLNVYADTSTRTGSQLKAVGMPTTLLIDAQGREVGRLAGPAEWDTPEAKRLVASVLP